MNEPYFSASNLYKKWDSVTVDFSMTAQKGTMTTIVGPSGCGKSTVLRLIAGLESFSKRPERHERSSGTDEEPKIILAAKDITQTAPGKRGIGMVFQNNALFDHLRIDDNVAYGLRCAGMKKQESRIAANKFLEQFGLAGFGSRYPQTLSGGEKQRVSLARTLIVHPDLVLFDEPLSALDAPLRKKLAAEIRNLQKQISFTGIMVTHDIDEAKAVSDRILLMEKGKKQWEGSPAVFSEAMI
ncbi:MAG: ABC transporter ATP-binding protein [Treponema sp.]|jgi:ABC-type Fe3+/spermidine/putrescine transport system ATPase subunit|nr:ABC transporter ATP-binding protein [Treponema sp.]